MATVPRFSIISCILFLTSCLLLAACGKKTPDGPSSATLERASLMQLAFPNWVAKGPTQKQALHIQPPNSRQVDKQGKAVEETVEELVTPEFVVRLSDDDAAMIFRGQRLDDEGKPDICPACDVEFGAVQFHRTEEKWYLVHRQDVFASAGSMGDGATPEIIKLSQHAFAFKLGSYQSQSGEEYNQTELYELTPNGPHQLMDKGVYLFADNEGMAVNCAEPSAHDANKPIPEEEQQNCYHFDSKWQLDAQGETPGDLILQFTGFTRMQDKDKQYRYHHVDTQQIWHYQDGKYVVTSGTNPIDKIEF